MPLAEAKSLTTRPRTATHRFQPYDPAADLQALRELAEWCEQFSPVVGLDRGDPPDGLLLDVTGIDRLFGGETALARAVAEAFHDRGYWARVAIAATIGAAWAVAHFADHVPSPPPPDGTASPWPASVIVPPEETAHWMGPLPIAALRLADEPARLLGQLGIERVEQLVALPRDAVATRLGAGVLRRIDEAWGICPEVIVPHRPAPRFEARRVLEHPTHRRETIDHILGQLTDHLVQALAAHDQGAIQVLYEFACQDRSPWSLQVGLFRPTVQAARVLDLVRMQLDSRTLPGDVTSIRVQALMTARLPSVQLRLFDDATRDDPHELAKLVERLSSRLGGCTVLAARLRTNALPEYAYVTIPLTGAPALRARWNASSGRRSPPRPLERPLRLLDRPLRLKEVEVAPDGSPAAFDYARHRQTVRRYWGPERIETAWWRGPTVRRDYYRVETDAGACLWLFRRPNDGCWFLHGEFE
jgi:protein ImuB